MKSAKVDSKGFTTLLWRSSYAKSIDNLPSNYCNFFWESVFSYLMMAFAWPGHLINLIYRDASTVKAIWWSLHIPICLIVWQLALPGKQVDFSFLGYVYGILISMVAVAVLFVIALITIGCIALKERLQEKAKERKYARFDELRAQGINPWEYENRPLGIVTWWKAFKGKYCPKIEWLNLDTPETQSTPQPTYSEYDND